MMKKTYNLVFILVLPALFILLTGEVWYGTGSPGGRTGSPGDGQDCTGCHSTFTAINQDYWIYGPDLLLSGYSPGETYDIFVNGIDGDANKFGFEATAEDGSGNKTGIFTAGFGGMNQTIIDNSAITHTALGTTPLADTGTVWFFSWTAPEATVGDVTFYVAVNAANGNGNTEGDQIYLSNFTASPATSIENSTKPYSTELYPNPTSGIVYFKNSQLIGERLQVINLNGQMVFEQELSPDQSMLDLSHLEKGIYLIRSGDWEQKLIIH